MRSCTTTLTRAPSASDLGRPPRFRRGCTESKCECRDSQLDEGAIAAPPAIWCHAFRRCEAAMARIAINGLGRIGRAFLKLALTRPELDVVAINELGDPDALAYLLRFDSA